jgi:hypothetical protein
MLNQFSHSQAKFQNLEHSIEIFSESLQQQLGDLVQLMSNESTEIVLIADKLSAELNSLKTDNKSSLFGDRSDAMLCQVDNILLQYSNIKEKSENLVLFCSSFGISIPSKFEKVANVGEDLKPFLSNWDLFKEYKTQLDTTAHQDWIHFRFNLSILEDFCGIWEDRMKSTDSSEHAPVIEHICTEISSVRKSLPALKYCAGLEFRDAHWCDLLQGKLNLPKSVRLESLCCYHFLQSLDILIAPDFLEFVKFLNTR